MSFTAVGSSFTWDTTPITFTPNGVGHLVVVGWLTKLATTPVLTGISSSNVQWSQLTGPFTGTNSDTAGGIWVGKVLSTSSATVTLTWSGSPGLWQFDGREFSSSVGAWALDVGGYLDVNTSNAAYVSLTPAAAGELYFGTHFDNSGAAAGSTSGYTYFLDSHGNGMLFNPSVGSGAQAPTWGDTSVWGGPMALIQEVVPPVPQVRNYNPGRTGKRKRAKRRQKLLTGPVATVGETDTLFGQGTVTDAIAADASAYTLGVQFEATQSATLNAIWFYSNTGAASLPDTIALFAVSGQSLVHSESASWSGIAGSGWVRAAFSSPPSLTASTMYKAAVLNASPGGNWYTATHNYWVSGGPGASGITSGNEFAPNSASSDGGQDTFIQASPLTYPSTSFQDSNYWIDPEISTAGSSSSAAVTGVGASVAVAGGIGTPAGGANITGVGAQISVAGGVGSPSAGDIVTGVGAAITVAGGVGTPHGSANVTGVGAAVTVAGGVGSPSAGEAITGTGASVSVSGGSGTPSGSANVAGVGALVAVAAGLGTPSGSSAVTGSAAQVVIVGGSGTLSGSASVTGVGAQITVSGGIGSPNAGGNINVLGVAAQVTVAAGVGALSSGQHITGTGAQIAVAGTPGTPSGSANVTGVAAIVTVAGGIGTPSAGGAANVQGVAALQTVAGGQGTPSGSANVTGVGATIFIVGGSGTATGVDNGDVHITGVGALIIVTGGSGTAHGGSAIPPVVAGVACSFQARSLVDAEATMEFNTGQPRQKGLVTLASDPWTSMYPDIL